MTEAGFLNLVQGQRLSRLHANEQSTHLRPVDDLIHARRDTTRVIYEILSLARMRSSKTQIVYRANLNFRLARSYIDFLLRKSLVKRTHVETITVYHITDRGSRLLRSLEEVQTEIGELFPANRINKIEAGRSSVQ